ncbi:probable LRR receptor-like serine/threonine-protein kinase At5g37450 isoform X1 [Gossypium hirsutum]|uniref:Probable LRR receptor-like serine/threonine-protein kinase At5g37450 isoform X1 n=1 Tax=Gossypium hirsutum TaxID=3635 RepID=A0A1U8K2Z7_GOSHI|nr:probable LRR receptor-like serine/threonine-protein kinase At5g37450 isoform X1 [Gossypium hirsutum]XP_040971694.1 probable LRR receptor-like serine/threonine-protein kinase At5g37450 isoform X1 [Gossypium hirsutum]XP_040971695.1 probable LRR receptor-like serine/threonine-protein kinase At5g37450 isoform X1 [Gossypium hirsutum]XP_040971696.1 probable LRR receptor-like serine/threonine-protein kinase At5g37450 isoform X1 [Gossypium hirsutum]XP_040971697.1 probable LRR receptor-like serine/th
MPVLNFPIDALQAIRRKLKDPRKNLRNWIKGDPCVSNWTGVICTMPQPDGFLHIQELRMLNLNLTGKLAPELGQLSNLTVLNFMWNHNITGSIPKEIGNIKSLKFLLLSGNQLSGPLADELGFLPNLLMFQVDLNQITGSLPKSFVNLISCRHFHMNNNSISGQIPSELSSMPALIHFLLDNNNLMGNLPPEFSQMPKLRILQLDNNNFGGTEIPASYGNISNLVKLSASFPFSIDYQFIQREKGYKYLFLIDRFM